VNNMVEEKKGLDAYKGTISSVILSIVVIGIILVPFITAGYVQKVREGDGKYRFKETMCWDIDEQEDFNNEPEGLYQECGEGALGYGYESDGFEIALSYMEFDEYPTNDTVNGYGIGITFVCTEPEEFLILIICLNLTKDDILDMDVTRIDIFLSISGLEEDDCYFNVITAFIDEYEESIGKILLNEISEIEIDIDYIIELHTLLEVEPLVLIFEPLDDCVIEPESVVIFDMQMYCIEEIKIGALEWIGIGMIGAGIFMIFCSVLMLPQIDFSGITKRIFGGGE